MKMVVKLIFLFTFLTIAISTNNFVYGQQCLACEIFLTKKSFLFIIFKFFIIIVCAILWLNSKSHSKFWLLLSIE